MPLPKLNLIVPQEGYSFAEDESAVLRAKLSGGPSRQRLDMLGASIELDMTLMLEPDAYRYWRAFYRTAIVQGSLPFRMDLVIDTPSLVEHEVKIVPGSVKLGGVQGSVHVVQLRLEVKVTAANSSDDAALVAIYGAYGESAPLALRQLAALVNTHIPSAVA